MNRRRTIQFVLAAAGAGVLVTWLFDVLRSGFDVGPAVLAGVLLACAVVGIVVAGGGRGTDREDRRPVRRTES